MNSGELLSSILGIVVIVVVIVGAVFVVNRIDNYLDTTREKECVELSEMIGLNTRLLGNTCYIEIEPNIWIAKYTIWVVGREVRVMSEQERIDEFNEATETNSLSYWYHNADAGEELEVIHDAWACGFEEVK